jgi:gamma-glutamyltranspeptidase/glutathione hydrolase
MIRDFTGSYMSRGLAFDKPAAVSARGVVASQNRAASAVGAQVLRDGGNAIDAAVATALALTVVEPWMSGLAGGGALLYYSASTGSVKVVDFSMVAPASLNPSTYAVVDGQDGDLFGWPKVVDDRNLLGAPSVAVPGVVAGLSTALAQFGTRSWGDMLAPAIDLARQGLEVDWFTSLAITNAVTDLEKFPASAADFLRAGQAPLPASPAPGGQPLRLPRKRLLATMTRLAQAGPRDFYEGEIASSIAADMHREGGYLSMQDLSRYQAKILEPDELLYRGQRICVAPGLNGGPTLLAALRDLAQRYTPRSNVDSETLVAHAGSLKAAWDERLASMGHSGGESCTTHLSVVDAEGNMVALTQTLLSMFGSRLTLPQSGLLMNNGIMWFDPVRGRPNSIAPGKRPLANFSPALLLGPNGNYALGGCGGRKIIPAVFSIISFLTDHGLSLGEAIARPRIDVSGNQWITADSRLPKATLESLAQVLPVVVAERSVLPMNYAVASAVGDRNGEKCGATEPAMPWAEAIGVS